MPLVVSTTMLVAVQTAVGCQHFLAGFPKPVRQRTRTRLSSACCSTTLRVLIHPLNRRVVVFLSSLTCIGHPVPVKSALPKRPTTPDTPTDFAARFTRDPDCARSCALSRATRPHPFRPSAWIMRPTTLQFYGAFVVFVPSLRYGFDVTAERRDSTTYSV
jgi:hypothetical protein